MIKPIPEHTIDLNPFSPWPSEHATAPMASPNLNSEYFPGAQLKELNYPVKKYLSESLPSESLPGLFSELTDHWRRGRTFPLVIHGQMGDGKSSWVTHVVIPYAHERNERTMVCVNRTVLSKQMCRDVFTTLDIPPHLESKYQKDGALITDDVVVMTYQYLERHIDSIGDALFHSIRYLVLDEVHYFVSDSPFNTETDHLLYEIPKRFSCAFRIYMTATPEEVIDPIYSAEMSVAPPEGILGQGTYYLSQPEPHFVNKEYLLKLRLIRRPMDFSAYQNQYYFSKWDQVVEEIAMPTRKNEKWVIFVESLDEGSALHKELENRSISSLFINSGSRRSAECEEWEYLSRNGSTRHQVLIATSVLDNGFSIHDPKVRNIVLTTEYRIRFLQELGRVRLDPEQQVCVYIRKTTRNYYLDRTRYERLREMFHILDNGLPDCDCSAEHALLQHLWTTESDFRRGMVKPMIHCSACRKESVRLSYNTLLRTYHKHMGEAIEDYDCLVAQEPKLASVLYKARWLSNDPKHLTADKLHYTDLDIPRARRTAERIEHFLQPFTDKPMKVPEKGHTLSADEAEPQLKDAINQLQAGTFSDFKETLDSIQMQIRSEEEERFYHFSTAFHRFYKEIDPEDSAAVQGRFWQSKAVSQHLGSLGLRYGASLRYIFKLEEDENRCYLRAKPV